MAAPRKYSFELRERAVRMYRTSAPKPQIKKLAVDLGVHPEALRGWIRQAEADAGAMARRRRTTCVAGRSTRAWLDEYAAWSGIRRRKLWLRLRLGTTSLPWLGRRVNRDLYSFEEHLGYRLTDLRGQVLAGSDEHDGPHDD